MAGLKKIIIELFLIASSFLEIISKSNLINFIRLFTYRVHKVSVFKMYKFSIESLNQNIDSYFFLTKIHHSLKFQ